MIALVPHARAYLSFATLTIMQPVHYHNEIQSVKLMGKKINAQCKHVVKSVPLSVITIPVMLCKTFCFMWILERQ